MNNFITLTVGFAKDQTRPELINMNQVYRIIERGNGCLVCFDPSGASNIEVKETKADIEKLLG
jgi:hypothetical protein